MVYGLPVDAINAFKGVSGANFPHSFQSDYMQIGADAPGTPNDPNVQNEIRWRVSYTDLMNGNSEHLELPCANTSLLQSGFETLDIDTPGSPGKALKDWLNTYARSTSGNSIQVSRIELA